MDYDFMFSVVMAVYNVEEYLEEAINSIINQDVGFDCIQLILVDDGSDDYSGEICDEYKAKYPFNIEVIHKENGGVSSARNIGLDNARGKYINFIDSDDMWESNAFSCAKAFLESNPEVNVARFPMKYFDAYTGDNIQNYVFRDGTRVVDLRFEPKVFINTVACAFFRAEACSNLRFDERLKYAEDGKYVNTIIIKSYLLGLISESSYFYRKRKGENHSATQNAALNKEWYLPRINIYDKYLLDLDEKLNGTISSYIKELVMYDVQWMLSYSDMSAILSSKDLAKFKHILSNVLLKIDDDIIMDQKNLSFVKKRFCLRLKDKAASSKINTHYYDDIKYVLRWQFYEISDNKVTIDFDLGFLNNYCPNTVLIKMANGTGFKCTRTKHEINEIFMEEDVIMYYGYSFEIPVERINNTGFNMKEMIIDGKRTTCLYKTYGKFFPISNQHGYNFYYNRKESICLQIGKYGFLRVFNLDKKEAIKKELFFDKILFKKYGKSGKRAALARIARLFLLDKEKYKHIWLVNDRAHMAGDNGEAMFRWLVENKQSEIRPIFVINKDSSDFNRLSKIGEVVAKGSIKHKLFYMLSEVVLSSALEDYLNYPLYLKQGYMRDIIQDRKIVFLQHGTAKDNISKTINRYKQNFAGFTVASPREEKYMHIYDYNFKDDTIWLTGLPRYDRLPCENTSKRQITVMPTWRRYLVKNLSSITGLYDPVEDFQKSSYCKFYHRLLSNKRLKKYCEKYNCVLAFTPHPIHAPHIDLFELPEYVKIDQRSYPEIFADSAMVVNDYSSASIDFSYMYRPVIYCQFDADELMQGGHTYVKGWYDYEKDGFGEIEYNVNNTVDRIIEYIENDFTLKDKYRKRIDNFFANNDRNNCKRVYEKVIEMLEENKDCYDIKERSE